MKKFKIILLIVICSQSVLAQEILHDYRLGERGMMNFDLGKQSLSEAIAPSSIDLNKINGSREKQKNSFDAVDAQIKKLEEFVEKVNQEITTLKNCLEETKQAVNAHVEALTRKMEAKHDRTEIILGSNITTTPDKDIKNVTEVVTTTVTEVKDAPIPN